MALVPQKGDSGFTLGGFLILAALGTFLWKGAPLDSVRPSSEQGGWYEHQLAQKVPARLWQDPFKAVYAHEQAIKAGSASANYEQSPIKHSIIELNRKNKSVELTLLLVQVSPGSYAELEERRRRRRYVVLSGLGEEHFVPRNPEMLNVYYRLKADAPEKAACISMDKEAPQNIPSKHCYAVPYEWYDYENTDENTDKRRQVLVLWLNESHFVDQPLQSIHLFLKELLPEKKLENVTLRAVLLGPARSDALRNLVTKNETVAYKWLACESSLAEFNIISSTATVADADLLPAQSGKTVLSQPHDSPLITLQKKIGNKSICEDKNKTVPQMHFLRTIQSDEVLINRLADELILNRSIDSKNDYVVLISEWDTYFGRSLPRAFTRHFCDRGCAANNSNIIRYSYLRGMDGIVVGQRDQLDRSQSSKRTNTNGGSPSIDAITVRRPVGTGQFDYLRRLAADIREKDRELRLDKGHGVRAVILLGSDVYDKLLILRALRPEMPGALFATTDLDAQLLHPAEYNWARSLIVASTYDLSLSKHVPVAMTTMPFRDSYQTSVYLATRMSVNMDSFIESASNQNIPLQLMQDNFYKNIPPQLMEIGRQMQVPLPSKESANNNWNIVANMSFSWPLALGMFTMAALGIFAFHQLRPMAGRVVAVLSALLLVFSLLGMVIIRQQIDGEPLNIFAGASIWPAEYIRIFSILLALVFIWSVIHLLRRNWNDLDTRYFGGGSESEPDGKTIGQLLLDLAWITRRVFAGQIKIKLTQVMPLAMVVTLILIMTFVLSKPLPLIYKIPMLIIVWGSLILLWWILIYGPLRVRSINKWVDSYPSQWGAIDMWRTYGEYGATDHRFMRTIAYVLIYFAFASFLFAILGSPASPCRGVLACTMDKAILGFTVLSMLVLLFLVVDAARLCICWVDSMRNNDLDWSNSRIEDFKHRLRLPHSHAVAWIQIHMIGERTSAVTRLIYYPVMIILLTMLARSTYFDNWDFPQALAIVIGMNFAIALGSVVRLNFIAQSVREDILRKLQDEKMAADRKQDVNYEPSNLERQELIHQLESLRIGAYLHVWDQPPVRATLMLLGGVVLTYAEYFSVFLR